MYRTRPIQPSTGFLVESREFKASLEKPKRSPFSTSGSSRSGTLDGGLAEREGRGCGKCRASTGNELWYELLIIPLRSPLPAPPRPLVLRGSRNEITKWCRAALKNNQVEPPRIISSWRKDYEIKWPIFSTSVLETAPQPTFTPLPPCRPASGATKNNVRYFEQMFRKRGCFVFRLDLIARFGRFSRATSSPRKLPIDGVVVKYYPIYADEWWSGVIVYFKPRVVFNFTFKSLIHCISNPIFLDPMMGFLIQFWLNFFNVFLE